MATPWGTINIITAALVPAAQINTVRVTVMSIGTAETQVYRADILPP